jgi:hypothetical protein
MKTFVAIWPDESVTVLSYPSGMDRETYEDLLWCDLDNEADPFSAEVYVMRNGSKLIMESSGKYRFDPECRRPAKFSIDAKAFDRYLEAMQADALPGLVKAADRLKMTTEVVAEAAEWDVSEERAKDAKRRLMRSLRYLAEKIPHSLRDPGFSFEYDSFNRQARARLSCLGTKSEIKAIREAVKDSDWFRKSIEIPDAT